MAELPKKSSLNPAASEFVFNPGASSFVPSFTPAAPAPPPAPPAEPEEAEEEDEEIDENDPLWIACLDIANGDREKAMNMLADPDSLMKYPRIKAILDPSAPVDTSEPVEDEDTWDQKEITPIAPESADDSTPDDKAVDDQAVDAPDETTGDTPKKAPAADQEPEVEETDGDAREHLNIVFIGHVDAGKSTLSGNILYLTDHVDRRTIEKYEREAKQRNRDSWFLAFIMDTNEEERQKGKTVEVGRAHFATDAKRYTILDAPGHKSYVPNMISGASQADIGILVISARKNEFESGFERGGQTREHAMLAKTLGVKFLIVVVNKMDDPTVKWAQKRYDEITGKLKPFLKSCGFMVKREVKFIPISALSGANVLRPVDPSECPWWSRMVAEGVNNTTDGELITCLDRLAIEGRDPEAELRIPVLDRYYDRGTIVLGKIESGHIRKGQVLKLMPTNQLVTVDAIESDEQPVRAAKAGDNVALRCNISVEEVCKGFMFCRKNEVMPATTTFICQLGLVDLSETRPIFTAGYDCMLHVHTCESEVVVTRLLTVLDPKSKTEKKNPRFAKKGNQITCELTVPQSIVIAPYDQFPQLGRLTLRDEGKSIAIGKVLRVKPVE